MCTLPVVIEQNVRFVICEGFMTSHTTIVLHRRNTTVFNQPEAKIIKRPEMVYA